MARTGFDYYAVTPVTNHRLLKVHIDLVSVISIVCDFTYAHAYVINHGVFQIVSDFFAIFLPTDLDNFYIPCNTNSTIFID